MKKCQLKGKCKTCVWVNVIDFHNLYWECCVDSSDARLCKHNPEIKKYKSLYEKGENYTKGGKYDSLLNDIEDILLTTQEQITYHTKKRMKVCNRIRPL